MIYNPFWSTGGHIIYVYIYFVSYVYLEPKHNLGSPDKTRVKIDVAMRVYYASLHRHNLWVWGFSPHFVGAVEEKDKRAAAKSERERKSEGSRKKKNVAGKGECNRKQSE